MCLSLTSRLLSAASAVKSLTLAHARVAKAASRRTVAVFMLVHSGLLDRLRVPPCALGRFVEGRWEGVAFIGECAAVVLPVFPWQLLKIIRVSKWVHNANAPEIGI